MHFSQEYDSRHITTSPHYAQANGEAEKTVQIAKQILKQTNTFLALVICRATSLQATGVSPTQLMLGRQICSTVLTFLVLSYNAWPYLQHVRQVDEKVKQSYRCTCDNRYCVRPLPELQPGSSIAVKLDNEGG